MTALVLLAARPGLAEPIVTSTVPFHLEHGFAVVVPVYVNGLGPYPFLLDTGATITSLDRELAQQVALRASGAGMVTTLAEQIPVSVAVSETIRIGPVTERDVEVMVRDLKGLQSFAPAVRGVLGQNALEHADFLMDYRHKRIEFDADGAVLASLDGHHLPLRRAQMDGNAKYGNLAVHAGVAAEGVRGMDLLLDSGTASLVLFDGDRFRAQSFVRDTAGREQAAEFHHEELVIDGRSKDVPAHLLAFHAAGQGIGGLLPTDIFSRLYISNSGGFAIFEPKEKKRGSRNRIVDSTGVTLTADNTPRSNGKP